jgi:hypothetical protein
MLYYRENYLLSRIIKNWSDLNEETWFIEYVFDFNYLYLGLWNQ